MCCSLLVDISVCRGCVVVFMSMLCNVRVDFVMLYLTFIIAIYLVLMFSQYPELSLVSYVL